MEALEESVGLSKLLIGPIHERLSNICLNARFATEPCANVTISDHLAVSESTVTPTLKRRRDGRADKARRLVEVDTEVDLSPPFAH
jgi:hypothetical protein